MAYELFFDGFESYPTGSRGALLNKFGYQHILYDALDGVSNVARRANTKGYFLAAGNVFIFQRPITPSTHVVCGVAVLQTLANGTFNLQLREGNTVHAQLLANANGVIELTVGAAAPVNSASQLVTNIWAHLGFGVQCSDTGSYEVRVNGASQGWFPATNADTRNGGTGMIDNIRLVATGFPSCYIDDFYIAYGDELAWLGDRRIDLLTLDANDTPQDWTPSSGNAWERLNAGDGYVASNIDEATSLFTLANLPYTPESIDGIAVRSLMDKSDAGARSAAALIKSGATEVESSELALSTDTLGVTKVFARDPATNAAWTTNAVNALKAGVRVKS